MSRQRYCKVSPRLHTGTFGRSIRGESAEMLRAQSLAGYLASCPHGNAIGIFFLPFGYIETDRGWGVDGASNGVSTLRQRGLIRYDDDSEWVWLVEHFRHEFGEDPKRTPEDGKKEDSRLPLIRRLLGECAQTTHYKDFLDHYLGSYPYLLGGLERPVDGASDGASDGGTTPRGRSPRLRARAPHQHQHQDQHVEQEKEAVEGESGEEPRDALEGVGEADNPYGPDPSITMPRDSEAAPGRDATEGSPTTPDEERRAETSAPGRLTAKSPTPDPDLPAEHGGRESSSDSAQTRGPGRASPKKSGKPKGRRIPKVTIPEELEAIGLDAEVFGKRVRTCKVTKNAEAWQAELDGLAPVVDECGGAAVLETWKEATSAGWQGCLPRYVRERRAKGSGGPRIRGATDYNAGARGNRPLSDLEETPL